MGWGECTHSMRTHGSALPGAESTPPRRKPHGSAMTPQPTQIFASVTADAPTEPTPSFSRVRSASLLDIYLRKVDGKRGRVERHCRSMVARTACRHRLRPRQKLAHRGARADQARYIFDLLLYYSLLLHRNLRTPTLLRARLRAQPQRIRGRRSRPHVIARSTPRQSVKVPRKLRESARIRV